MDNRECILYARFSSDRQNPLSCEDQLRDARAFAERRRWRVVAEFSDAAISGTKGRADRAGWDQLLALVERGGLKRGGIVLTWDIDRWSRDWADGMIEALRLGQRGISLADTKDGVIEQDSMIGRLQLTLKVGIADEFITKLRRNVKRGLEAKRNGGYNTGTPPYGYDSLRTAAGSVLTPNPAESPVVQRIFEMIVDGVTPAAIARTLNSEGIPTKRGKRWTPSTIRLIGTSPVFLGNLVRYDSRAGGRQVSRHQVPRDRVQVLPGLHEAIVSRVLWERAQKRLEVAVRGPNSSHAYPLSGSVFCGECSRRMQVTGGQPPWRYYRCRPYGIEDDQCRSRRIVRIDALEAAAVAFFRKLLSDPETIRIACVDAIERRYEEQKRAAAAVEPIRREIESLSHKQGRLLEALYAGTAPSVINAELLLVEQHLSEAQERLQAVAGGVEREDLAALMRVTEQSVLSGPFDLSFVREFDSIRIIVPADPAEPPRIRIANMELALPVDEKPAPRGRARRYKDRTTG